MGQSADERRRQPPSVSARRSLAVLAAAAFAGGLVMASFYGVVEGLQTAALLAAAGGLMLAMSHLLAARRSAVGSLARQFQVGVGLVVGVGVIAISVIATLMFVSAHDAFTMALLLAFAGGLVAYSASLIAGGVMRDIESVRNCVVAIGEGERDLRCETAADDELGELAVAANRMIDQLSNGEAACATAWSAHRDLIAAVSHDLRTPLTSLQLLSEAIEDDVVDADTRTRYRQQISIQIRSLGGLVEDLFELSRLEAGDVQWSMQQVSLDALVEETVEAMQAQASAKGIAVTTDVADGTAPAKANPEKVQRVLFNLMQNAIRHTPPDGTVTVAAKSSGATVEVEVADSGAGVDVAESERVFEPFYRGGREASRTDAGSGLGLTICRAIVEAHGGRIWLPESGPGMRVRFSLPLAA